MIHVDPALSAPPQATATAATAAHAPSPARALIEAQMAVLSRLTAIGMEIAEACGRDARAAGEASAPAAPPRDFGLVFARVARAVRMTIALQSRLAGDLAALDRAEVLAAAERKDDRRMRLSRLVGEAARAGVTARHEAAPADAQDWDEDAVETEIEQLADDAYERLTDAEDGDLWGRSFDEVVAGVCKDLGLSPDWRARLRSAVEPPPGGSGDYAAAHPEPPPLPVILGLVPRIQGSASSPPCVGPMDPRDKPEEDAGGNGLGP